MRYFLSSFLIISMLLVLVASAQQQPSTPLEQAMGAKLVTEINAGLQCTATVITISQQLEIAKAQLETAKARIAELEKGAK